jgi:RNA polymerase sigma factor (sigma-70 family)
MYHSARRQKDIPVDRTVSLEDADNAAGAAVDSVKVQAALSELTEAMAKYIRTLPERDQKIFVARYRFEAPVSLISRRLGIPAGTVMSSLHRLRKGLKSFLKEEGIEV